MGVSSTALALWRRHATGLERSALLSCCLWLNGVAVKQALPKIKLRSKEFTVESWSTWLETFSKYGGFCYLSARGRKVNAGASVVYRWRLKCHRQQQQQHIRVEPGSGRSRKDQGIGAADWLQMGVVESLQGCYQEVPIQVRRVNFKNIFFPMSQHCLVLAMTGIRSDSILQGSCSHGVCIMPKAGHTKNLPREAGLPDP